MGFFQPNPMIRDKPHPPWAAAAYIPVVRSQPLIARQIRTRWQKLARGVRFAIITLVFLALVIRLALPFIIRHYVNRQLSRIPDFRGHVEKVRLHLYRGAYSVENLEVVKTNGSVPVPFIAMPEMDLSVDWRKLFHGS